MITITLKIITILLFVTFVLSKAFNNSYFSNRINTTTTPKRHLKTISSQQQQQQQQQQQCEFSDIDIFFVTNKFNYNIMRVMLTSFDVFMPCYNHMHVFVVLLSLLFCLLLIILLI